MTAIVSRADQSLSLLRRLATLPLVPLTAVAAGAAILIRFLLVYDRPLWLDETFTAAIAAEPSVGAVLHQTLLDVNAPGYYLLAHAWTSLFSLSNASLRMPSLIVSLIAPFLCLVRTPGLEWRARLMWFASVALWQQGAMYSYEARCYSLLYFLVIANTLAFMRLVADVRAASVLLWGVTSAAMIFVHYIPIALVGAQALILLWLLRARVLGLWPAAIALAPVTVWFFVHLSRIREFTQKDIAWYHYLTAEDVAPLFINVFGALPLLGIAFFAPMLIFYRLRGGEPQRAAASPMDADGFSGRGPWLAAAAGLGAMLVFVAMGFFRPSFTPRYLIAFAPAYLLFLPLLCERVSDRLKVAPTLCLALIIGNGLATPLSYQVNDLEYQSGAEFLMTRGVRNVAFLWDNPNNQAEAPEQMRKVGGFFFDRKGANVVTTPIRLPLHADPNVELQRLATAPRDGFIWVYDVTVRHTAATRYRPRMAELSANYECLRTGAFLEDQLMIGALSCIRKDKS